MTALRRLPDWPERLAALERRCAGLPFAWGVHDCFTWAADAVLAITGVDLLDGLRGRWAGRRQAMRLLADLQPDAQPPGGLVCVSRVVSQRLGEPLPSVLLAQRGDVVLVTKADGATPGLAVCLGAVVAGPGASGLVRVPLLQAGEAPTRALCAWGVGHA